MLNEEHLDSLLAKQAMREGWAENKLDYCARILKHLLRDVDNKDMRCKFREVIKFLEDYKLEP
jgi:hypothetical protein